MKLSVFVPQFIELDIDEALVEAAIAEGAREGMRRKGLVKGQNLDAVTHEKGRQAAEDSVRRQIEGSGTGGVRFTPVER